MSIVTLLDVAEEVYGDRLALGSSLGGMSYRQLGQASAAAAADLVERGVESVVYLGLNSPMMPVLLFATARAGVPLVPLNYRWSAEQLRGAVAQFQDPLVLVGSDDLSLRQPTVDGARTVDEWLAEAVDAGRGKERISDRGGLAEAVMLFTSGTSSEPKGVLLRHEQLIAYVLQTVELASCDEQEATLVSVPPYHVAGVMTALTNVYGGRRVVYLPDFDPEQWLDVVREEEVTNAMVVPTMLARIVTALNGKRAEVPSLKTLAYGGARMSPNVLEQAMMLFPDVGFVNAYGLTETSSTIAVLGPDDHRSAFAGADPAVRSRLGSVGRLVPGVEGQVRDGDGAVLPVGETGELWVRGTQVSGEYRGLGSVLDDAGWFPTRDLARFDADGYLFVEGRADDTIIRGGENIAPAEIEDVIERHPGVREVAVTGIEDDEWGQRIVAAIVVSGLEVDTEEIRSFVRERLRGSRTPDDVIVLDELPYGPTGKLLRRELRQLVAEKLG